MLHTLELSPGIVGPLTAAVRMQIRLLEYAASSSAFDEERCAAFVNGSDELRGRGQAAADWVNRGQKRRDQLNGFAAHHDEIAKLAWVQALSSDAEAMLESAPDALTPVPGDAPEWQKAGAEFLRLFYVGFSSESGLPGEMLGLNSNFSRYDFLRLFDEENAGLYVCAACDEGRVGTRHKGRTHADIDHFFPKSIYPHLSVHPYNLVPVCHPCNSAIKGPRDPLDDGSGVRLKPSDLVLPYRSPGLSGSTFVMVDLDAWRRSETPFTVRPIPNAATQCHVEQLGRVAEIPARWNEPRAIDEIGETAFRRLNHFLHARAGLLDGQVDKGLLLKKLDEFLGVLRDENLGLDPLSIPMKWLLAHLVERAQGKDNQNAPLLQELLIAVCRWVARCWETRKIRRGRACPCPKILAHRDTGRVGTRPTPTGLCANPMS